MCLWLIFCSVCLPSVWTHHPYHCLSLCLAASPTVSLCPSRVCRSPPSCSPINMPTDIRTIRGCHFLWYGKAILYFISLFICPFVKEMPLAVYYAPLAGKKYLQKDSRRLPASCNASLVHCLRTNVSTMFWANKLLYSRAIWCRKRQSWRSRVCLNAASGSVRERFIWNYCCALLWRVADWCCEVEMASSRGEIGELQWWRKASLSSAGHMLLSLRFIRLGPSSAPHMWHTCSLWCSTYGRQGSVIG